MRTIIGTLLSIILISCYSFAERVQVPDLGDNGIQYTPTINDSKDREIGIKRYSDPSIFPMIGWRGMIIETDDRDSTYYVKISNNLEEVAIAPEYNPNHNTISSFIRLLPNQYREGKNDEKSYRFDSDSLDRSFGSFGFQVDFENENEKYSLTKKFNEGLNKYYAFIPSRIPIGHFYRKVFESPLHTSGTTIYYRWWVKKNDNGNERLIPGNIHSYINPRKISISLFGDSFGSGEGAPGRGTFSFSGRTFAHPAWINNIDNEDRYWFGKLPRFDFLEWDDDHDEWLEDNPSHRSINSGFELALKNRIIERPDFAINFGNYSWSGAIADVPPIDHDVENNERTGLNSNYAGPKTMWGQLKQLNNVGPNTTNEKKSIDALFIGMGGNDAGFGHIVTKYLRQEGFDITDTGEEGKIEDRHFNTGTASWINILDRKLRTWSDFFNDNFNGGSQPNYNNLEDGEVGPTENLETIHDIAWFNYPDVTAGSPDQILNLMEFAGIDFNSFDRGEWSQVKPVVIDVINGKLRNIFSQQNSKITLYEHPNYNTGGLGIPYNYVDDIKYYDPIFDVLLWEEPKGFHTPKEYASLSFNNREDTDPNRWYNHFFIYGERFEPNDFVGFGVPPTVMGSFHPNENGFRNAYLPLYKQAFKDKLNPAKLHLRSLEEGVSSYPDLVGESLSISASFDQETDNYNISGQFKVKNLTDEAVENNFKVQLSLKSSKMEYQNGRPVPIGNPTDINIEIEPIEISPEDLDNPQDFTISINSFNNTSSEFHHFIGLNADPIDPFTAFLRIHIPQRYTVAGEVDSQEAVFYGNDIYEAKGENNNTFIIGEVYPDPAYDPKLQQSLRDQSRQFEIELRGLVKEAGGNLPDSTVEELDPEWLENLINRAFGEAQIKDRMEELTGFRKPDGKIENRAFEDEMVIPISEMYRMADFAKALSDREKGIEILSSMKGSIPLINKDLAFDEIQFSHVKNQEVHGIANFADALAECRYLMDEMEFTYFKYSQNKNGLPEYTAYQMKLDTGGLFRGIRAEMDNKDNLVVFIDPNELPDEIAKGPIQINIVYDDPGQFIRSIEREGIIEKTTIIIPKEDWLGDQVQDGRGILVDVSVQKTADYYGAEIPIWSSLAGYRVPTKSQFPSVELPLIEDFGQPDPVNVFRWQSPKEGINPDWTHARLQIKSGSKILLEEIAEYSDQKISFEKMYQTLAGYGVNLTVDFELGNKDFSISSGVKSYPFHYPYKVPLIKPVLIWNPPQEWSEGLALTSEIQNANASYNGKELEGDFEYSFKAGDQLRSGNQVLQATFIPNSPEYATSVVSRLINVKPSLSLVVKEDPFRFEFGSIVDQEYQIEVSEDLQKWTILKTFSADSVTTTYEPEINGKQRVQFYRVTTK